MAGEKAGGSQRGHDRHTHAEASFTQTPTGALTFNLCCNAGEVDIFRAANGITYLFV